MRLKIVSVSVRVRGGPPILWRYIVKRVCTIMVGMPYSGKSTLVDKFRLMDPYAFVYSTDRYIESKSKELGSTYNDIFADTIKEATAFCDYSLDDTLVNTSQNIIWDQTNLSRKKRGKIVSKILSSSKDEWVFNACFITIDNKSVWDRRITKQHTKCIPENILHRMESSFQMPTLVEGFEKISVYNINGELKRVYP